MQFFSNLALIISTQLICLKHFPGGSDGKASVYNAGDPGSIPGLGRSPGVDCHFLLQGIFPTQGSNPGLPHCRQTLYRLNHLGSA